MDLRSLTVADFLKNVSAKAPTPGGGAVVGVCAATSAALACMVTRYSQGRRSAAEHEETYAQMLDEFERASEMFTQLAQEDIIAYECLSNLLKLENDDERKKAEQIGRASCRERV